MRSQQSRKLFNQPMKSPSPDIANRSIISNTKSPVNDVRQYIKMRQNSQSPKGMTMSFHQIASGLKPKQDDPAKLRSYIAELQLRLEYLEKVRLSYDELKILNEKMNAEIISLKQQLRRLQQQQSGSYYQRQGSQGGPGVSGGADAGYSKISIQMGRNQSNLPQPQSKPRDNSVNSAVSSNNGRDGRDYNQNSYKPNNSTNYSPDRNQRNDQQSSMSNYQNNVPLSEYRPPHQQQLSHSQSQILREFNERTNKFIEQNKRLLNKLNELKNKNDQIKMENMRLNEEILSLNRNGDQDSKYNRVPSERKPRITTIDSCSQRQSIYVPYGQESQHQQGKQQNIQELKRYFREQAEVMYNHHRKTCDSKIVQNLQRMQRLQADVSRLRANSSSRKRNNPMYSGSPYEMKANISTDTKTDFHDLSSMHGGPSQREDPKRLETMAESQFTSSPSIVKAFASSPDSPMRTLEEQRYRMLRENEGLLRRIRQMEMQLNKAKKKLSEQSALNPLSNSNNNSNNSGSPSDQAQQEKIQHLNLQLQNTISQIKFKDQTISDLQKRIDEIKRQNKKQQQDLKLIIRQEKEKNIYFEKQLSACNAACDEKLDQYQDECNRKLNLESEKQGQLSNLLKMAQNELVNIKDTFVLVQDNMHKYLEQVVNIRHSLTSRDISGCIEDIERTYAQKNSRQEDDELEIQINKMKDDYQELIQNFRKQILSRDQHITDIERKNHMLLEQIQQYKFSENKLRGLIEDYKTPIKTSCTPESLRQRIIKHQHSAARQQCQIRDYINVSVTRINSLQQEVQYIFNNFQINSAIKKSSKNSIYRRISHEATDPSNHHQMSRYGSDQRAADVDGGADQEDSIYKPSSLIRNSKGY